VFVVPARERLAYVAGMVACAVGAVPVAGACPGKARDEEFLAAFHTEDTIAGAI
jgi:hypothetical protein